MHTEHQIELISRQLSPFKNIEEFQRDVVMCFHHYIQAIEVMVDYKSAHSVLTSIPSLKQNKELINYIENGICNLNSSDIFFHRYTLPNLIKYEDIRETKFVSIMEQMYYFAYFGKFDGYKNIFFDQDAGDQYNMQSNSFLVTILKQNDFDWLETHDLTQPKPITRLIDVIETANARCNLEDGFSFLLDDGLNVRQVSLLSGMEESSIRAATTPNRPNPLHSIKTENGIRFAPETVKAWLISKNRYIPVSKFTPTEDVRFNFKSQHFISLQEIERAIENQYNTLWDKHNSEDEPEFISQLQDVGLYFNNQLDFTRLYPSGQFGNILADGAYLNKESNIDELATILEFDELLTLRIKQFIKSKQKEQLIYEEKAIKHKIQQLGGR